MALRKKKGIVLESRAREIVFNVYKYFENEKYRAAELLRALPIQEYKKLPNGDIPLSNDIYNELKDFVKSYLKATERVALATGIHRNTVLRIRNEKDTQTEEMYSQDVDTITGKQKEDEISATTAGPSTQNIVTIPKKRKNAETVALGAGPSTSNVGTIPRMKNDDETTSTAAGPSIQNEVTILKKRKYADTVALDAGPSTPNVVTIPEKENDEKTTATAAATTTAATTAASIATAAATAATATGPSSQSVGTTPTQRKEIELVSVKTGPMPTRVFAMGAGSKKKIVVITRIKKIEPKSASANSDVITPEDMTDTEATDIDPAVFCQAVMKEFEEQESDSS